GFFFFQAEDGIRDGHVTGVQTCALPISTPQKPQKTCWLFMSVAVLCAAGAVESVVSENGMGSLPIKAAAGGGQSWLVGYGSPEAESPGVQAMPSFGPPKQHPLPPLGVHPPLACCWQSGQGWMPGTSGRSAAVPSSRSPVR